MFRKEIDIESIIYKEFKSKLPKEFSSLPQRELIKTLDDKQKLLLQNTLLALNYEFDSIMKDLIAYVLTFVASTNNATRSSNNIFFD